MERKSPKSHIVKIPMAKSTLPRSPTPRSPMPKSPIPRSPLAYDKYKSKCAYGLISFFRFQHRHSKKMISDTYNRSSSRYALDDRRFKSRLDLHSDQYIHDIIDEKTVMINSANVNKIRRNVCTKQQMMKTTTAKVENIQSDSERVHDRSRKIRRVTKTSWKPRRLPIYGCYDVSTVGNASPMNQNLALDSSDRSNCRQCDDLNEINLQVNLNEATEAFINQKLIDGRHVSSNRASHHSKHFLDALGVLNSNKDLFVKLVQDPNFLLVKHIEDLKESREKEHPKKLPIKSELLEHHLSTRKEGPFKENGNSQPLENIVVLKPCQQSLQQSADKPSSDSPQIHYGLRNVKQNVKPAFFSFKLMKRKLLQAIRVSRKKGFEESGRETGMAISRKSLENAASDLGGLTTSSMDINRKYQTDKVDESGPGVKDEAGTDSEKCLKSPCSSAEKHDVHAAPRIDISELKSGNMNFSRLQRAKSWHEITCDPDYDFLPKISSGRTEENDLLSPQRRYPAYNSHQMVSKNQSPLKKNGCFSPVRQNLEAPPWVVNRKQCKPNLNISSCSVDSSETETSNSQNSEELSPTESSSGSEFPCNNDVNQSIKTVDTEESGSLASSRIDSSPENQTSISTLDDYSSSPLNHQSLKEFDVIKNSAEQPSPISVLDQFFREDVNSPSNTKSLPIWQLQIDTDEGWLAAHYSPLDLKIKSSHSMEECGSVLDYISNVLQASNFTWDELLWRCCFSDQLLDPTLFEEINARCCGDHKLLFDYVNEVVLDAYWCYVRCLPWLSFMKPRILPDISTTGNIVHEMMKYVDQNLLLAKPLETLENIIEMDLTKSGKWTDIRIDAEDAVSEMIDSLLEELTIEIALQEPN